MQAEQGYLRTGWPVRLCEVGDSGGGADLIDFLTNCVPQGHGLGPKPRYPTTASTCTLVGVEWQASAMARSVKIPEAGPTRLVSPHRLEAQDTALSRRRHGFESRWGHRLTDQPGRAISSGVERLPYKEEVAGSNPASPTQKKRRFAGKTSERREGRERSLVPSTSPLVEVSRATSFRAVTTPYAYGSMCPELANSRRSPGTRATVPDATRPAKTRSIAPTIAGQRLTTMRS